MRILLVEDEKRLSSALAYILKKEHYIVDLTGDGIEAEDMALTGIYDIIVLDRMLPNKEGVEILKSIRKANVTSAVIFLTAKDSIANKIEGLDAGADDYLVKPFAKEELLARIRALGRRKEKAIKETTINIGKLKINSSQCSVMTVEGEVKLSVQEMQLLEYLSENKGQVLNKEQIFDKVWGFNKEVEMSNVELYVFYIRKKINLVVICIVSSIIGIIMWLDRKRMKQLLVILVDNAIKYMGRAGTITLALEAVNKKIGKRKYTADNSQRTISLGNRKKWVWEVDFSTMYKWTYSLFL